MYPAIFLLPRPERSSRLLLIFRPVLIVPHLFWAVLYAMAASFVQFLSFWAIIFTGRHPRGLWNMLDGYFRYSARLQAWAMYLTERYPPFSGSASKSYPIGVRVEYPARMSRATVFFRLLVLLPHYFYFVGAAFVYMFIQVFSWWTILFLGRMTDWQFSQISSFYVYAFRFNAYTLFLVDEYPPFNGMQPRAADEQFL